MNLHIIEILVSVLCILSVLLFASQSKQFPILIASIIAATIFSLISTIMIRRQNNEDNKELDFENNNNEQCFENNNLEKPLIIKNKRVNNQLDFINDKVVNEENNEHFSDDSETVLLQSRIEYVEYGELRILLNNNIIRLSGKELILGRSKNRCDVIIPINFVSQCHATLKILPDREPGKYYLGIRDHNSTNGTFVNGTKVTSSSFTRLYDKDIISLGNVKMEYHQYEWFDTAVKEIMLS